MKVRRYAMKAGWVVLIVVLLLTPILFFQPRWLISLVSESVPGVIYFADTDEPMVALTIDDGPDPVTTPKILEVLSRHHARATFFLISGRVPGNENVVSAIARDGHELGNHMTTGEASITLSSTEFEDALVEAHNEISAFGDVRWFRPGSGWYNARMLETARKHNYRCALGSVFPYDIQIPWIWFTERHVLLNAHHGSIIIMHDVGSAGERTALALETILPELTRQGYRVVTLSDLVE